jgi:hypothetical protein
MTKLPPLPKINMLAGNTWSDSHRRFRATALPYPVGVASTALPRVRLPVLLCTPAELAKRYASQR